MNQINETSYYQIIAFSNTISTSAFPAKNILFLNKSPDILSSLIVSIVLVSLICFANRIKSNTFNQDSKTEFINKISWGGIALIAYTYFIGINDFFNHNIKMITGSLREVEVIPKLFVTDWRGVFYSAEGGGEIFFLFSFWLFLSYRTEESDEKSSFINLILHKKI